MFPGLLSPVLCILGDSMVLEYDATDLLSHLFLILEYRTVSKRALAVCFLSLVPTKCFYRCDDSRGKLVVDPCREALFCRNCRGLLWVLGCARAEDRVPRARNRYSGLSGIAGDPRTHNSSIILAPGHQWQPLAGLAGCWALPVPPPATSTQCVQYIV